MIELDEQNGFMLRGRTRSDFKTALDCVETTLNVKLFPNIEKHVYNNNIYWYLDY